jgi:hypothetical protein
MNAENHFVKGELIHIIRLLFTDNVFLFDQLNSLTVMIKPRQKLAANRLSDNSGENNKKKPLPLISEEKLDTRKGHINRRNDSQKRCFSLTNVPGPVLRKSAYPTIIEMPSEFNQILGSGLKYKLTMQVYQIR